MHELVSPTILIVDDEKIFCGDLREQMMRHAAVGSLVCDNLADAAEFIANPEYHFDALLTDLLFETGDARDKQLFDGVDLIKFAAERRPKMAAYAVSAQHDSFFYRYKVKKDDIPVKYYFDKRNVELSPRHPGAGAQPWNVVCEDVYRDMVSDPRVAKQVRRKLSPDKEVNRETLVAMLMRDSRMGTRTYLQALGAGLKIKRPIEVICMPSETGAYRATASRLALLVDGIGGTPLDALKDLKDVIADHARELLNDGGLTGYAGAIRDELAKHVEVARAG